MRLGNAATVEFYPTDCELQKVLKVGIINGRRQGDCLISERLKRFD